MSMEHEYDEILGKYNLYIVHYPDDTYSQVHDNDTDKDFLEQLIQNRKKLTKDEEKLYNVFHNSRISLDCKEHVNGYKIEKYNDLKRNCDVKDLVDYDIKMDKLVNLLKKDEIEKRITMINIWFEEHLKRNQESEKISKGVKRRANESKVKEGQQLNHETATQAEWVNPSGRCETSPAANSGQFNVSLTRLAANASFPRAF